MNSKPTKFGDQIWSRLTVTYLVLITLVLVANVAKYYGAIGAQPKRAVEFAAGLGLVAIVFLATRFGRPRANIGILHWMLGIGVLSLLINWAEMFPRLHVFSLFDPTSPVNQSVTRAASVIWTLSPVLFFIRLSQLSHRDRSELERLVAERTEELDSAIAKLSKEISDREHIEKELIEAQNHLESTAATRFKQLQEAKAQILHQDRLSILGKMVASVSHDLMNSVAPILYFTSSLKDGGLDERQQELVEFIDRSAHNARRVGESLRGFYGKSEQQDPELLNLKRAVDDVVELVSAFLQDANASGREIELVSDVDPTIEVYADVVQARQLFANLILNSVDSIEEQGTISVRATALRVGALVEISDDGCGMSEEVLRLCRQPFFTSKESGTGLGLSICDRIVQSFGTELRVESAQGNGTTISFEMPTGQETPLALHRPETRDAARKAILTCLFVDDNEMLRNTFRAMCESFQVAATVVASGEEAITALSRRDFDIVITDVDMDGMNGLELASQIKRAGLEVSVILVSGLDEATLERHIKAAAVVPDSVITKPVEAKYYEDVFRRHAKRLGKSVLPQSSRPLGVGDNAFRA